jgi:capsular exopolysaccharide synthesis family protein
VIAILAILGILAGLGYGYVRPPSYQSTAKVLVKPISPNPLDQPPSGQSLSMDTEREIVASEAVAEIAVPKLAFASDPRDLLTQLSVETPPESQILEITFTGSTAGRAQAGAQAFADAYLEFKNEQARATAVSLTATVRRQIDELQGQLEQANQELERAAPGSNDAQQIQSTRDVLVGQIALLQSRLAGLSAPEVDPGDIIAEAFLPSGTANPTPLMNMTVGGFLGISLGLVLAFLRDRVDDRPRHQGEVENALGAPVLATVPGRSRKASGGDRDRSRRARAASEGYRTGAIDLVRLARPRGARCFMVTSAGAGEGTDRVAANLAIALAESGRDVTVVDADMDDPTLHDLFGVRDTRGVATVLNGIHDVGEAVQPPSLTRSTQRLRVLPSGTADREEGRPLREERLAGLLERLLERSEIVIVRAPSLAASADALIIAAAVDATIVSVDARRTSVRALIRLGRELERSQTPLLGSVLGNVDKRYREWDRPLSYAPPPRPGLRAAPPTMAEEPERRTEVEGWPL